MSFDRNASVHLANSYSALLFTSSISEKYGTCLHNETKGKRCTSDRQSLLERLLIQPKASENEECHTFCLESGYTAGGHCSLSKECFRFCLCYHFDNSSLFLNKINLVIQIQSIIPLN